MNLGNAYASLGKYRKAIAYYKRSASISKLIADRQQEGIAYANLGKAYDSLGKYQQAIKFHERSLSISKEIGDSKREEIASANLEKAHKALLGEYPKGTDNDKPPSEIKTGNKSTRDESMSTIKCFDHLTLSHLPTCNINLFGQVGEGKSSFYNKTIFIKEFNMYTLEDNPCTGDTMGLEPQTSEADFRNLDGELLSNSSEYTRNPGLKYRAHYVVISRGIPLFVLLTHKDEFLPEDGDDITKIFHSETLGVTRVQGTEEIGVANKPEKL
ncbi:G-protein-signaling modulator 2 [Exaiptasia diaphana]|uniref:Uncharacterized protein n=1 Tax=Exaiptasia diaphana TaxID=2652724 RepID=A0A913XM50_EXADI|nr:G-protein-signaling modulator 2 [Exaiptasia diaphana]KXJ10804.1 G-protein-signaling modulator 2 [Exaiptasia diaphana]